MVYILSIILMATTSVYYLMSETASLDNSTFSQSDYEDIVGPVRQSNTTISLNPSQPKPKPKLDQKIKKDLIKTPKSQTQPKAKKPKLKKSNIEYKQFGENSAGNFALVRLKGVSFIMKKGDEFQGFKVLDITRDKIEIEGYEHISRKGHQRVLPDLKLKDKGNQKAEDEYNQSPTKINKQVNSEENDKNNHNPKEISPMAEEKPKPKRKLIRTLINNVIDNPKSILDIISMSKTTNGYLVMPKSKYKSLFKKMGLKPGDEVIKINNKSVNSSKIMVEMMKVSNEKKVRLLMLNNNRYRILNINLMGTYR